MRRPRRPPSSSPCPYILSRRSQPPSTGVRRRADATTRPPRAYSCRHTVLFTVCRERSMFSKGCPTHSNCAPAPLGSHNIAPLLGGQHLTGRRHRPHDKRHPARRTARARTSRKQANAAALTSGWALASSRVRSSWSPKSVGEGRNRYDAPSTPWPAVEVSQHFTRLPTQAPPARKTRICPQAAEMPLPLPPHTDGAEDVEDADAALELTIADMPVASIELSLPSPMR